MVRIMTPGPQKIPQLSSSQRKLMDAFHKQGPSDGFSAAQFGGLPTHTAIRAMWRKGWVTPITRGDISMHTIWNPTRKFYTDFPEYKDRAS